MSSPGPVIRLSAPSAGETWSVPVLFEDSRLFAVDKPAGLLTSPDRYDPERPNLMKLLHRDIERQADWAAKRGLQYLSNAHRLDFETSGVLLLAKDKPALVSLANQFGSAHPEKVYVALVQGVPEEDSFEIDLKLKPDERAPGRMRWARDGKQSLTRFTVVKRFRGTALVECRPVTGRTHQIRVHLKAAGYPIYADDTYGDGKMLFLSSIKRAYRLKEGAEERPLTPSLALHAWKLTVTHPESGLPVTITAPWPKDLEVAYKYLRRYAG